MMRTRREFLWTAGSAAAAVWWLRDGLEFEWTSDQVADQGWAPGIEERLSSACLLCPAHCGIRGRVVDGRLVRITGNPLHPMSRGGVCPRGIAGVQLLYHPERIRTPLLRVGQRGANEWRPLSREEAINLIAERLQSLRAAGRPQALALVAGDCSGSMEDVWRQFLQTYGSPNYVCDAHSDGSEAVMGLMHGIPRRPGYDLDRTRLVVSFGAPLFEAWWSPLQAFIAFGGSGGAERTRPRFVQVDTRFSRTAARAHEWIAVRPGTHGVLALGIAYVLIKEELYDHGFVSRHVSGFEDGVDAAGRVREGFRSMVLRHYRTEEVSTITGVPVERVVSLAKSLVEAERAIVVCGADVMHAPDGLLSGLAVHSLNVLTGNINRPGGTVFGDAPPLAPLAPRILDAPARAGLAVKPIVSPAPFSAGDTARRFAEVVAQATTSPVDALLFYHANPLASSAHAEAWVSALSRIGFVVSFSPFLDETARQADLILPDLLPYERWQDAPTPASYPYPVWALARPLVEPRSAGQATGDAVLEIAQRVGGSVAGSLPYADFVTLLKTRARGLHEARRGMMLGTEFERIHYRQMEERGWWLPENVEFDTFWEELVARGGWTDLFFDETDPARLTQTPSDRIELLPAALQGARPYVPSPERASAETQDFRLRLIPYRISTLSSEAGAMERWLAEAPTVFADRHWVPWVDVHPVTAAEHGLAHNMSVWVTSPRGRYRARVKLFQGTAPGTVCAPYGIRHPGGELANPLQLLDGSTDPLTGMACWFTTFVRLEPAPESVA